MERSGGSGKRQCFPYQAKRGLKPGERTESWTIERPEDLIQIHQDYVNAGADIVNANTFGVNKFRYPSDTSYSLTQLVETAIANAAAPIIKKY